MEIELSSTSSKPDNKHGLGRPVLFALPFAAFGTLALFSGVTKLVSGDLKNGIALTLFGCIFSLVGFGLIIGARFGSKFQKKVDALKQAHPNEPWLWREDWASGRIKSSNRAALIFVWTFALVWNAISSALFFTISGEIHRGNQLAWIAFFFPIVGMGLLAWAISATLPWKKFGQSWFRLTTNPGTIGGQLAGHIETSIKIHPKNGYHISLRCIDVHSSGKSKTECIRWEDEKVIMKDALDDPRQSRIPVFFEIPADCSPSDDSIPNHRTVWRLKATAKVKGPDYSAIFEVPVFKTAETPVKLSDPTLAYQAPAKPYKHPPNSPIKLITLPDGATEFYFPAFRNKGPAFGLLLSTIVWTGALWLVIRVHAPIMFPIVFGLIGLALFVGLFMAFFKSSRVTLDTLGLHSCQNWLIFRTRKNLTLNDIANIEAKIGMTSGSTIYYDIKARSNSNRSHTLASSIKNKKEAEWLASEMQRSMGKSSKSSSDQNLINA